MGKKNQERINHFLRLSLTPGLGPVLTKRLLQAFGSPQAIVNANIDALKSVEGIGHQTASRIRRGIDEADVTAELKLIEDNNISLVLLDDDHYPALLKFIHDPPSLLYVKGNLQRNDTLGLGVVGSRKCTRYGREQAQRLAAGCAQAGLTITSGGARGIDGAAHRAALQVLGRTVVVLGCGIGHTYPPEHLDLFNQIIAEDLGVIISELPYNTPPMAENFPKRNRIISGMSVGTLVIEAGERSGALITARLAAEEHHREVMAIPGPIDSPYSKGTNKILRDGWAQLVTSTQDILHTLGETGEALMQAMNENEHSKQIANEITNEHEHQKNDSLFGAGDDMIVKLNCSDNTAIQWRNGKPTSGEQPLVLQRLSKEQQAVMTALGAEEMDIDDLAEVVEISMGVLLGVITYLELTGLIQRLPANRVCKRKVN